MASALVRSPITASYLGSYSWTSSSGPTITVPGVSLGSPIDRTLLIVLSVNVATGGTPCVLKVNGVSARIDVKSLPHVAAAVGRIFLPASETVGSIEVTTGNSWRRTVSLYEYPGQLLTWETGYGFLNGDSIGPVSAGALRTGPEGFALGGVAYNQNSNPAWSWTGLPTVDHYVGLNESVARLAPTTGATIPDVSAAVTSGIGGKWLGIAAASYVPYVLPPNVVLIDRFNHADGLHTHADTGQAWATLTTPLSTLRGRLGRTGSTGGFMEVPTGITDMAASFEYTNTSAWTTEAHVRHVAGTSGATNTGYFVRSINTPRHEVIRAVNGNVTSLFLTPVNTYIAGERITLSAKEEGAGTRVTLTNSAGTVLGTALDTTADRPMGQCFAVAFTNTASWIDNLEVRAL